MKQKAASISFCLAAVASLASAQPMPGPAPAASDKPRTSPSAPASGEGASLTPEERETLNQLHASNVTEIESGKLARKRARNEAVKRFANEIVKDHEQAERELGAIAKQSSVSLRQPSMQEVEALGKTGMGQFDHQFITMMAKDHDAAIKLAQEAREKAQSKPMQDLLTKLLPVLEKHQQHALQQLHTQPN